MVTEHLFLHIGEIWRAESENLAFRNLNGLHIILFTVCLILYIHAQISICHGHWKSNFHENLLARHGTSLFCQVQILATVVPGFVQTFLSSTLAKCTVVVQIVKCIFQVVQYYSWMVVRHKLTVFYLKSIVKLGKCICQNFKLILAPVFHLLFIPTFSGFALARCICPNCTVYFYKLQNVFVQIGKCIFSQLQIGPRSWSCVFQLFQVCPSKDLEIRK